MKKKFITLKQKIGQNQTNSQHLEKTKIGLNLKNKNKIKLLSQNFLYFLPFSNNFQYKFVDFPGTSYDYMIDELIKISNNQICHFIWVKSMEQPEDCSQQLENVLQHFANQTYKYITIIWTKIDNFIPHITQDIKLDQDADSYKNLIKDKFQEYLTNQCEILQQYKINYSQKFRFINSKDYSAHPNSYFTKLLNKFWENIQKCQHFYFYIELVNKHTQLLNKFQEQTKLRKELQELIKTLLVDENILKFKLKFLLEEKIDEKFAAELQKWKGLSFLKRRMGVLQDYFTNSLSEETYLNQIKKEYDEYAFQQFFEELEKKGQHITQQIMKNQNQQDRCSKEIEKFVRENTEINSHQTKNFLENAGMASIMGFLQGGTKIITKTISSAPNLMDKYFPYTTLLSEINQTTTFISCESLISRIGGSLLKGFGTGIAMVVVSSIINMYITNEEKVEELFETIKNKFIKKMIKCEQILKTKGLEKIKEIMNENIQKEIENNNQSMKENQEKIDKFREQIYLIKCKLHKLSQEQNYLELYDGLLKNKVFEKQNI